MRTADAELFQDKIEVSLDGRQIFYLFFGGAVVACLVFVLGVMVGKRLEARSHVAAPAADTLRDPLAALDQLNAREAAGDLSFPAALTGDGPIDDPLLDAAGEAAAAGELSERPEPASNSRPAPAAKAVPSAKAPPEAKQTAPKAPPARFTLQLSSFQDQGEAEAFRGKLAAAGYAPYVVEAEVPDKGTWFRVRLGKYGSYDEAIAAKSKFEDDQHIIAYVTRL